MKLTGQQIEEIENALLIGFPTKNGLRRLARIAFDQKLEDIARGKSLREVAFNLIIWAADSEDNDRIGKLLQGAYNQTSSEKVQQKLVEVGVNVGINVRMVRHLRLSSSSTRESIQSFYNKSWALVIGINDYGSQFPQLGNAVNDARAVGDMLEHVYGFDQVHRLFDAEASQDAIRQWLFDTARQEIGSNDRLILFFAGHGTSLKSAGHPYGYLIPQDARDGAYSSYLDMEELKRSCGLIPAKHILLILDCCFSGIAAVTTRSTRPASPKIVDDVYLQSITKRRTWQVLTAGSSDELAADSSSRPGHSAFTSILLEALQEGRADHNRDGIITASDVATYIKPEVSRATAQYGGAGQTPFFNYVSGSEQGDFVFMLPAEPVHAPSDAVSAVVLPSTHVVEDTASSARVEFKPAEPCIEFDWVMIPAGEFWMGSDNSKDQRAMEDEMPQHSLYLGDFSIAKYPVTNAQFDAFVRADGYTERWRHCWTKAGWRWRTKDKIIGVQKSGGTFDQDNHPVVGVSWYEAVAFCRWLGEKLERAVMLPSEAQWEKAARGTDGRIYPWGAEEPSSTRLNFDKNVGTTTKVGSYPAGASPYGVLDMAGNVWEWTSSQYRPYPYDPQDGREYLEGEDVRTLRGGAWLYTVDWLRCANRDRYVPNFRDGYYGFRVVLSPGS